MKPTHQLHFYQQQSINQNINNNFYYLNLTLKSIILFPIIFCYLAYRIFEPKQIITCYIDNIHQITAPINKWLRDGSWPIILAIGQILTDGWTIFIIIFWIIFSKNMRHPITVAIFFSIRSIFLNIQKFPFPENIIWRSPGIPSAMVPYDHTRDFFYSGHTGTMLSVFLEMYNCNLYIPSVLVGLSTVYVVSMLLVVRIHYTIDVLASIIFIIYFNQFVKSHLYYIDYIWSIPFMTGKFICDFFKKKFYEQDRQNTLFDQ